MGRKCYLDDFISVIVNWKSRSTNAVFSLNVSMVCTSSVVARIAASLISISPFAVHFLSAIATTAFVDRLSTTHPKPAHFPTPPYAIPASLKQLSSAKSSAAQRIPSTKLMNVFRHPQQFLTCCNSFCPNVYVFLVLEETVLELLSHEYH